MTDKRAHKVMTFAEYMAMPLIGWHEVCRDVDGFGGVGIRYLGSPTSVSEPPASFRRIYEKMQRGKVSADDSAKS